MRKTKVFEGKKHVYDTAKAIQLASHAVGYYGDPAGYEETIYQTKAGLYFACGRGGVESPYAEGEDIRPLSADEAEAWL